MPCSLPRRLVLLLCLLSGPALCAPSATAGDPAAVDPAAVDPVEKVVRAFLEQRAASLNGTVQVTVAPATATLPPCPAPEAFLPGHGQPLAGRVTVGVRCQDAGASVRYRRARVSVTGDYWVTARPLDAGTVIDADMLARRRGDLATLPDQAVLRRDQLLGRETRRPLAAGVVPQSHQVRRPPLIERRQPVTLVAGGEGFRITREGRALDNAGLGGQIRVRLPDRRVVTARVTGPGEARVSY
ncbi:flagellar basal body P-ring formation chaperone FlgA [Alloalcanivorax marinus]|uniref:flagellar basal body P-ring formation chaperone FlgA n=1 Tax=Alloalcanivorax marinus TaxID=1177169 RepID=UPI00195DD2F1|nr:flagellar basal body P-ring formation chaperone FlgA [Alloalcanivorax marinus]MBM7332306.1 flagellar basal body P-ring formation protein FlgA [Alloalcanivorax marinus]